MTEHVASTRSDEMNRALLRQAYRCATKSVVPTTQTGSFLAVRDGSDYHAVTASCNEAVRGAAVRPEQMADRAWRDVHIEHAERNAIYAAARWGIDVAGHLLVTTWLPCVECARAIIQAGISEVLVHESTYPAHWEESITRAKELLEEAGVVVTEVTGVLGGCESVRRVGVLVAP